MEPVVVQRCTRFFPANFAAYRARSARFTSSVSSCVGSTGPHATPAEIVNQLSAEISKILASPDVRKKAEDAGTQVEYMGPAQLGDYTRKELEYWGRVIQSAKITAD